MDSRSIDSVPFNEDVETTRASGRAWSDGLHRAEGCEPSLVGLFRQKLVSLGRNGGECIQTLGKWLIQSLATFQLPYYQDRLRYVHMDSQGNRVTDLVPIQ